MSTQEHYDPLTGDQDRFVHPDLTRSDEQVSYEEGVKNRLHMSGTDDSDDYWAEYEAIYGNGNNDVDAAATQAAKRVIDREHAPIQEGVVHGPPSPDDMWDHYHPDDDQYGLGKDRADLQFKRRKAHEALQDRMISEEAHSELQKGIEDAQEQIEKVEDDRIEEEDRKWAEEDARILALEEDQYEDADEDPLAGDVDKWVHPDETKDAF
jgi:hypothetical protein